MFMNYLFHHCPIAPAFNMFFMQDFYRTISLSLTTCGVTGWVWSQSPFISKTVYMICQLASRVFLDSIVLSHIYLLPVPFLLSLSLSLSYTINICVCYIFKLLFLLNSNDNDLAFNYIILDSANI